MHEKKILLSAHIKSFLRFEQIHCIENAFMLYSEKEVIVMWNDILEFVLLIFDDIIGFFHNKRKDHKKQPKKQTKSDQEKPL